jgi:muramoyltetrapeptide carboxypeptidase
MSPIILEQGDVIEVIAPSSGMPLDEASNSIENLRDYGFVINTPNDLLYYSHNKFHANSDEYRLAHFKEAITSDSKAIWTLRGGYGSAKLIPELIKMGKPENEKFFIGFSDITNLNIFLNQFWGWKPIHGPVISQIGKEDYSQDGVKSVIDIITGQTDVINLSDLECYSNNNPQEIKGEITGGNLTVLTTTLGTPWQIKGEGKILFFEDIQERGYKVDRMLNHMKNAGVFNGIEAVVFGNFDGGNEADGSNHVEYALRKFAEENSFPVFKSNMFGHGYNNIPLVIGAETIISKELNNNYNMKLRIT